MTEKGYGASIIGSSHLQIKKPNQDSYLISNNEKYTLAVVCDGLGSKKYSHIGSRKLCKVIDGQIAKCFQKKNLDLEILIPLLKKKWKRSLWPIKSNKADTTCMFIIVTDKNIMMCQIGDGLCVMKENSELKVLTLKNDDFSNETITFNRSTIKDWSIDITKKNNNAEYKFLLCTDGISEDLKMNVLSEFIDEISSIINDEPNDKDNNELLDVINNWPNKYSNDDKTIVVVK